MLMAWRLPDLAPPSKAEINQISVTVNVSVAGRPNRLPTGYRSISRTMNPCASLTKPYIKQPIFRAEGVSSANQLAVCARGEHCACLEPGCRPKRGHTSRGCHQFQPPCCVKRPCCSKAFGGQPDHRPKPLCCWNADRALNSIYRARPSISQIRLRANSSN